MESKIFVFDPTVVDKQSKIRGIGRYLQLLKENFPNWKFVSNVAMKQCSNEAIFINPFFNFLQPPLTMKRIAGKQIAVIHDLIPLKYPDHFPVGVHGTVNVWLNKLALRNYDLIVTDSQTSKKDIVRMLKIEESRVKVVYPCLPKNFTKYSVSSIQYPGKEEYLYNTHLIQNTEYRILNTEYCLYVGDATWNKNLVNLAKAIKIADISCVFTGKAFEKKPYAQNIWLKEFNEFMRITKDDKRFIIKGFVSDYELIKFFKQSKVNLLLSRDEGFGFSYVEAAQFGCPSVLSDVPVLKEVSAGCGALFADPNKPEVIAQQILKVYNNEQIREKLSLEAQGRAKFFSLDRFVNDWNKALI